MTATSTIGAGPGTRDYATIAGWWADIPATLTEPVVGEIENDGEIVGTATISLTGKTGSSTNTMTLRPASGAGFKDAASPVLAYDATKGVAIRCTSNYTAALTLSTANVILDGIQIKGGGTTSSAPISAGTTNGSTIRNCIFEGAAGNSTNSALANISGSGTKIINCLFYNHNDALVVTSASNTAFVNCTITKQSGGTAPILRSSYASPAVSFENCAFMGSATLSVVRGTAPTFTTCIADDSISSPPSGVTTAAYSSAQFVDISDSTHDFRLVSGSALIDAGTTDSTNAATDIFGTSRPQGSAYDVGAHEFVSAAATSYTLTGPTSGTVGEASSNFTLTPSAALSSADTITLSDGGAGGTFTPSSLSFASGDTSGKSFTYQAAASGTISISVTSGDGLTVNGSPISYVATNTFSDSISLSGSGGLSLASMQALVASSAIAAAAAVSPAATIQLAGSVTVTATGAASASATQGMTGAATVSGTPAASASATLDQNAAATISASSGLALSVVATWAGEFTISAAGALDLSTGPQTFDEAVSLTASAIASASGALMISGTVSLAGTPTASASAALNLDQSVSFTGTLTASAAALLTHNEAASIFATAAIAFAASSPNDAVIVRTISLSGQRNLVISLDGKSNRTIALSGSLAN